MKGKKSLRNLATILIILGIILIVVGPIIGKKSYDSDSENEKEKITSYLKVSSKEKSALDFGLNSESVKKIIFEDKINVPSSAVNSWDISLNNDGGVMAYILNNKDDSSFYDLYIQGNGKIYANANSSYLFYNFINLEEIKNLNVLDTTNVTNMSYMFQFTGKKNREFTLDLGDNFDTSNVVNMRGMFNETGFSSLNFTLELGDKFDTSKVTDMSEMFQKTGYINPGFTLDLGNNFNTDNVVDMSSMFNETGYSSLIFMLELRDKFNTGKVTNMSNMFQKTGYSSRVFTLDLGDKFDTSDVTNMNYMFDKTGYSSEEFKVDCSTWNVLNVIEHIDFNAGVEFKVIEPIWK